jgi:predicted nucleic acid-binding protein
MTEEYSLIDSNIIIYAFDSTEKKKHEVAKRLLMKGFEGEKFVFSVQNLSEFFVVITKKVPNPISAKEANTIIKKLAMTDHFWILNFNAVTITKAIEFVEKYKISYWDALIAATMLEKDINIIYTENTKDFSKIPEIKAINPLQ